jgi:pyridoxine/pyridoxamine 5'-phosphate oxidase
VLLLKGVDERGFVFFTNMESPKAQSLLRDSRTALCFYWMPLEKQVRVRGRAVVVSDEEADAYFATRPRLSQISAWASKQSQPMEGYFGLKPKWPRPRCDSELEKSRAHHSGRVFASCRSELSSGRENHFAAITGSFTNARERAGESTGFTHSHKSPAQ